MSSADFALAARHRFVRAALDGNHLAARDLLRKQREGGRESSWIIAQVLAPAQFEVGRLWEEHAISVAEEHVATAVTQACLDELVMGGARPPTRGRVLITGAEGEWHTLPSQMVAQVWRAAGWQVMALTPSLPVDELQSMAARDSSVLGAVSCALPANLIGAWQAVSVLREAGLRVLVGGAAFDRYPELATVVGADAHDPDPVAATEVLTAWAGAQREPRAAVQLPGWPAAESAWEELGRIVVDAYRLLAEYQPVGLSDWAVRDDTELFTRVAVVATAFAEPVLLADHAHWYGRRLRAQGAPGAMLAATITAIGAVLPAGADGVREHLRNLVT